LNHHQDHFYSSLLKQIQMVTNDRSVPQIEGKKQAAALAAEQGERPLDLLLLLLLDAQ
jgi:hypothetical protein